MPVETPQRIGQVLADSGMLQGGQGTGEEEPNKFLLDENGEVRLDSAGNPKLAPTTGFGEAQQNLEDFRSEVPGVISGLQGETQRVLNTLNTSTTDGQSLGNLGIDMFQEGSQGMAGLLDDPSSILNDPLIQAQLAQGIKASEASAAAGGTQISGGQLAELQNLGNVFAGTQIENQFNRFSEQAGLGLKGVAGGMDVGRTQLQGQEQFANIGLAGLGLEGDLLTNRLSTEANIVAGANASKSNKSAGIMGLVGTVGGAILGGPIGASIGGAITSGLAE